jgi:hypothetical protein
MIRMIYIPSQKSRLEEQTNIDEGEDVAFTKLAELAREANEDKWESKVDKYVKDRLTEEEVRMNANRKLNDEDLEQFMSRYASLIQYILQLKDGRLHLKVTKLVDELVQDGMDYNKAIQIAIRKYKHMLENYLDEVIDNENYEESDDEEDNDNDDRGGGLICIKEHFFLLLPFYLKPPYHTDGFLGTIFFFYYDPSIPVSFAGPDKLYRFVRKNGKFVLSKYKIRKWLQRQEPYSLQRPLKRSFKRNKVIVKGIDDQWDVDLMDMTKFAKYNNG